MTNNATKDAQLIIQQYNLSLKDVNDIFSLCLCILIRGIMLQIITQILVDNYQRNRLACLDKKPKLRIKKNWIMKKYHVKFYKKHIYQKPSFPTFPIGAKIGTL